MSWCSAVQCSFSRHLSYLLVEFSLASWLVRFTQGGAVRCWNEKIERERERKALVHRRRKLLKQRWLTVVVVVEKNEKKYSYFLPLGKSLSI